MTRLLPALLFLLALGARAEDNVLLIQTGPQGYVVWHAEGKTQLPEEQITEIALSALPEGGPRLRFGDRYAKAFLGRLGITVTLWRVLPKK